MVRLRGSSAKVWFFRTTQHPSLDHDCSSQQARRQVEARNRRLVNDTAGVVRRKKVFSYFPLVREHRLLDLKPSLHISLLSMGHVGAFPTLD